jgi:tetratricopeptide (TPR) repeat protein
MCRDAQGAADAESLARRSLDLQRRLGGDERPDTINTLNTLASILNRQGRFEECETLLDEALAVARKTLGQDNPMVALLLLNLGSYRIERLDFAGAEPPLREALAINRARREPEHPEVFGLMYRLAWACGKLDMGDDAEAMFREALSTARRALPASDPQLGDVLLAYGEFVLEHVGAAAAEPLLCEVLAIYEVSNPGVDWLADARLLLGRCLLAQRRFDEAEPLLVGGYGVLRELYGAAHPKTCAAFDAVVALYESSNDAEKLEALLIDAPAERSAGDARP